MKLFLTGGTGFVGSHFIQHALAAGHSILALRRPGSTTRVVLDVHPTWLEGPLDGDYRQHLEGVDVLVHLASHTPNPPYAPLDECLYWNVFASLNLARQACEAGVKKFLVAGTCFEYGRAATRLEVLATDAPLEPEHSYATSKAAAAIAFEGFAREKMLHLKLLRIFQTYGEGELQSRFWPSLREAAVNGRDFAMSAGEQIRDFVPVQSVAAQFVRHLDFAGNSAGEPSIHHVCSGAHQSLLEFAQYWWRHWGATGSLLPGVIPYRPNEIMRLLPAPDSAR